ncbi:MAG: alanine racemase [Verrucomicrobia bacterium]|nr:alanine racemase [Verrucomicrobiota bacterium]
MSDATSRPPLQRPAWIEINESALRQNHALIVQEKNASVGIAAVLKDNAYGHGAFLCAQIAAEFGAKFLVLVTLTEALDLRLAGVTTPMLLLGQRQPDEIASCVEHRLTCCVNDIGLVNQLAAEAQRQNRVVPVHVKINTGMNRYGIRWDEAPALIEKILAHPFLELEGVMSHFSMSDELDKSFAHFQLSNFRTVLDWLALRQIQVRYRHHCNSGGFLDLPEAHFDLVRIGLLPLGIYPSTVVRRIHGLEPVMTVKTKVALLQNLTSGDSVGYGMRYTASCPRRIAVLPLGYGDGFPRVRNEGHVLIRGKKAPLVGGVSMDAITVDVTDIHDIQLWDEVVIMGRQGQAEISVHDLAALRHSVSYDQLCAWRNRLPRIIVNSEPRTATHGSNSDPL